MKIIVLVINGTQKQSVSYDYDGGNMLKKETVEGVSTDDYAYNTAGNMLCKDTRYADNSVRMLSFSWDWNNRMTATAVRNADENGTYTYDDAGRLMNAVRSGIAEAYSYDIFGRITSGTKNDVSFEYTYDANGLRTSKTIDGATTYYVYDGENIIAEISGGVETIYLRDNTGIVSRTRGNAKEYFVSNYRGDTTAVVNANADILKSYEYDAFGNIKNPTSADDNPFRYCGEYFDDETGFVYLRNRYYDPSIGRFTTEDPAKSGLNWYAYCENNPVKYIDPWGLDVYYFVNTQFRKEADKDKKGLEKLYDEPVHILETDSRESFIDEWNMMGSWDGENVDVSLVVINMHGNVSGMAAYSDSKTGYIDKSDIEDGTLIPKYIDDIVLLSCNSGHFDHRYTNIANRFLVYNTVDSVIASDGSVDFRSFTGKYKSVSSKTFIKNLWSEKQYRDNYGYVKYTKNEIGELEWKILGKNHSIKSMIKEAGIK